MAKGKAPAKQTQPSRTCLHRGEYVAVADITITVGAGMDVRWSDFEGYDTLIPLGVSIPCAESSDLGNRWIGEVLLCPWKDYQPPPKGFVRFLEGVVDQLKAGRKVFAFCAGGHGRTGTFLAALIAILEPDVTDPVQAARERYCPHAVETQAQADFVYSLMSGN